ncbi:MAG: flagellar export protein FliJ [Candidatus Eisenbacteria bacterium]
MKRFRFPLEGVSKVRETEVKSREATLARAQRGLAEAGEAQRRLVDAMRQSFRARPAGTVVDVSDLLEVERERARIRGALIQQDEKLRGWLREVESERDQLLEAKRRAEAVEKLRERRYLEFIQQVLREEQGQTDEVAGRMRAPRQAA